MWISRNLFAFRKWLLTSSYIQHPKKNMKWWIPWDDHIFWKNMKEPPWKTQGLSNYIVPSHSLFEHPQLAPQHAQLCASGCFRILRKALKMTIGVTFTGAINSGAILILLSRAIRGRARMSKCYGMDCFGTYFTHVQTCDVTRVQTATEWTASVHTSHMSKPVM